MPLLTERIPAEWRETLQRLQTACPEAFIGGGAMRDLDNDRPVKDVDIFVRSRSFDDVKRTLGPAYTMTNDTEDALEYEEHFGEVLGVYEAIHPSYNTPFNIISCNGPVNPTDFMIHHVRRFDLGICQIGWSPHAPVYVTAEYLEDKNGKMFTILGPRPGRSLERAQRIRDRAYPTWTINPVVRASLDNLEPALVGDGMEPEDL